MMWQINPYLLSILVSVPATADAVGNTSATKTVGVLLKGTTTGIRGGSKHSIVVVVHLLISSVGRHNRDRHATTHSLSHTASAAPLVNALSSNELLELLLLLHESHLCV